MHARSWLLAILAAGCGASASCGASEGAPAKDAKPVDPCSPSALRLPGAIRLTTWTPPERCAPRDPGSGRAVLRTQAEVDANLECPKGTALGVDLAKHSIVKVSWMMSPAAVGLDALDDRKTLTLVTRFRSPCPNDPHPMPMTTTLWYLLPAGGAERTFGEANCTIETKCR
jgi:hypothetical protein